MEPHKVGSIPNVDHRLVVGTLARYEVTGYVGRISVRRDDMYLIRGPHWSAWAQRDELEPVKTYSPPTKTVRDARGRL